MDRKRVWRDLCKAGAAACAATVLAGSCTTADAGRALAGIDAIVNYEDEQDVSFSDWLQGEIEDWF